MAEKKDSTPKEVSKKRVSKKTQTVRERTKTGEKPAKTRRIRSSVSKAKRPVSAVSKLNKKEYHIPLPDSKFGRFLRRPVKLVPRFFREAFFELRKVTWPSFKQTIKLTLAVFLFAIIFASIVGLLDFGLNVLFEKFILK